MRITVQTNLTVLQSFPAPRPTSVLPYTLLLADRLRDLPGVTVLYFDWRTALLGRYDVFHVHWPEILVNGHSPLKKLVRQVFTLGLLAKLKLTRTPLVRTVHNVDLPKGIGRREKWLLALIDRQTTLRVVLNPSTPVPSGTASALIPQAHYREWFAEYPQAGQVAGRVGYVGRIRGYKGLDALISAFRGTRAAEPAATGPGASGGSVAGSGTGSGGVPTAGSDLSLQIGGYPSTQELADDITALAAGDDRIAIEFGFISDERLVEIVTSSELVVLPYPLMHNSAAAITVLSLDRPILVPDNPVNRQLSDEVGPGWIHFFTAPLGSDEVLAALRDARTADREPRPRLGARDWHPSAVAHADAYRAAIALAHRGR